MRADLLALTDDDLATLANVGLTKRARKDIESGEFVGEIAEDEVGNVSVKWSDDVTCVLPNAKGLSEARCTCPAAGICRHILRSVMAYQFQEAPLPPIMGGLSSPSDSPIIGGEGGVWNPGAITDEQLQNAFPAGTMRQAQKLHAGGLVWELYLGARPTAYCHSLGIHVRFLVPNDPRYIHTDSKDNETPAILAVWAFRALPEDKHSGIVEPVSGPSIIGGQEGFDWDELATAGLAHLPSTTVDRVKRAEADLRKTGSVWIADTLVDILDLREAYQAKDARFSSLDLADWVGEYIVRTDASEANTGAVPALFIRGSASDQPVDLSSSRFIGLGASAKEARNGSVTITLWLQDNASGRVATVVRHFSDTEKSYADLARSASIKNTPFSVLASGQLLVQGGKRAPSGALTLTRSAISVTQQAFAWEKLRAPVLKESFAEVAERLALLPPAPLRPRRVGEDLHVVPVLEVRWARFDTAEQAVLAEIVDTEGGSAVLYHPYTSRGAGGVDALLTALSPPVNSGKPCFIAGGMRLRGSQIIITPTGLVTEYEGNRQLILPALAESTQVQSNLSAAHTSEHDPIDAALETLRQAVGDLLLTGTERFGAMEATQWRDLHTTLAGVGLMHLAELAEQIESNPRVLLTLAAHLRLIEGLG
jgi:hypothetical protein